MSILNIASGNAIWRGYDYFENKKVLWFHKTSDTILDGAVQGNGEEPYQVTVDVAHPKRSVCNCPHAEGNRKICKHKIAVYFSAFPEEANRLIKAAGEYEEQEEKRQTELQDKVVKYVHKLKKSDLEELVLQMLFCGPEWQYEHFIRDYIE